MTVAIDEAIVRKARAGAIDGGACAMLVRTTDLRDPARRNIATARLGPALQDGPAASSPPVRRLQQTFCGLRLPVPAPSAGRREAAARAPFSRRFDVEGAAAHGMLTSQRDPIGRPFDVLPGETPIRCS